MDASSNIQTMNKNKMKLSAVCEVGSTDENGSKAPLLKSIKQEPVDTQETNKLDSSKDTQATLNNVAPLRVKVEPPDDYNSGEQDEVYDSSKVVKSEQNSTIIVKQEPLDRNESEERDTTWESSERIETESPENNLYLRHNVKEEPQSEEESDEECEDSEQDIVYHDDVDVHESDVKSECDKVDKEISPEPIVGPSSQTQHVPRPSNKPDKTVSGSENRYACNICDKTFSTSFYVKIHQRIHSGDKPFECDICQMKFSFSPVLKRHKRTHSGEKPYECNICLKKFTRSSSLTQHKRNHPYNEYAEEVFVDSTPSNDVNDVEVPIRRRGRNTKKPYYECDGCMKKFAHSSNLKRHQRIRNRGKTYKCDICMKDFIRSSCLKTHKRSHGGKRYYECDICMKKFSRLSHLKRHKPSHEDKNEHDVPIIFSPA